MICYRESRVALEDHALTENPIADAWMFLHSGRARNATYWTATGPMHARQRMTRHSLLFVDCVMQVTNICKWQSCGNNTFLWSAQAHVSIDTAGMLAYVSSLLGLHSQLNDDCRDIVMEYAIPEQAFVYSPFFANSSDTFEHLCVRPFTTFMLDVLFGACSGEFLLRFRQRLQQCNLLTGYESLSANTFATLVRNSINPLLLFTSEQQKILQSWTFENNVPLEFRGLVFRYGYHSQKILRSF